MQRFLDVFATPREAGGLKVPQRRENEEHGNDGGDQAVATYFADKAQLQVDKVHRRNGAHRGVKIARKRKVCENGSKTRRTANANMYKK